jgi:hypothetical protein
MVTSRHQDAGISEIEANPYGKGMSEKLTPSFSVFKIG